MKTGYVLKVVMLNPSQCKGEAVQSNELECRIK